MNSEITNFELRQIMLSFAYLAYTGEEITEPNPEAIILNDMRAALPKITLSSTGDSLADWDIVWGPAVYTVPGSLYQDNLLYIAQKTNTSQYVIATRGTNFASQVDWFLEDFEVINTMPWPIPKASSNCKAGSAISESTSIGMAIQLSPSLISDNGMGLLEFLLQVTNQGPIDLCVTGHSLGGVLSNTLALYLLENTIQWDQSSRSTVSCISFAAPTGGNSLFADNAITVFQDAKAKGSFPGWDESVGSNLDNVMCNMDGAPFFSTGTNVYEDDTAGPLFSIYAEPTNKTNNIDFNDLPAVAAKEWEYFKNLVLASIAGLMTQQDYKQLMTSAKIQGKFIGDTLLLPTKLDVTASLSNYLEAFAAQAAWQHSCSYPIYLGMSSLFDPSVIIRNLSAALSPPHITSISPSSADRFLHPKGVSVSIEGSGFSDASNFLVFSGQKELIPYRITKATSTEIRATFFVDKVDSGEQTVKVVGSSPFYTSNGVTFDVEGL